MKHKIRVGRYTAALLLVCTGVLLLLDEWRGTDYIFMLQRWWPLLFILLGVEYIVRYTLSRLLGRRKEFRFRPDLRGFCWQWLLRPPYSSFPSRSIFSISGIG